MEDKENGRWMTTNWAGGEMAGVYKVQVRASAGKEGRAALSSLSTGVIVVGVV